MIWLALLVTGIFAAVHLLAGRLRFLSVTPRSRWLSAAGGVSVAYVFVHLLPEAEHFERQLVETVGDGGLIGWLGRPVYLLAMVGVVAFYGLERWVVTRRGGKTEAGRGEGESHVEAPPGVFWLHLGSFGLYNALICYLLVIEAEFSLGELGLYALAMSLHFVVNDFGLREHHPRLYQKTGRFLLASAALAGWAVGAMLPELHAAVVPSLFGFLCGATVLNVLKEELPAERESRFWAFALGEAAFAALLLALPAEEGGLTADEEDASVAETSALEHRADPPPHSPA